MTLAYKGASTAEITAVSSTETRRQQMFDAYIRRMFAHRGIPQLYPIQQALHWLAWLAANMFTRQQTIFLIERLQPDWLQIRSRVRLYRLLFGLFLGLGGGLLFGLFLGPLVGLLTGLFYGLLVGVLGALNGEVGGVLSGRLRDIEPVEKLKFNLGVFALPPEKVYFRGYAASLTNRVLVFLLDQTTWRALVLRRRVALPSRVHPSWQFGSGKGCLPIPCNVAQAMDCFQAQFDIMHSAMSI